MELKCHSAIKRPHPFQPRAACRHISGLRQASFALLVVVVGITCCPSLHVCAQQGSGFAGDITCAEKRFLLPGLCIQNCRLKPGRSGLAQMNVKCWLSPKCPRITGDVGLVKFYNDAMFGIGFVPPALEKVVVVEHMINTYYKPYSTKEIAVVIGPSGESGGTRDRWASTLPAPRGGKATMTISGDLFYMTPGYMLSTIGHEMVHVGQLRRTYKTDLAGINEAVGAFRELEASSWELHKDEFARSYGPSSLLACMNGQTQSYGQQTTNEIEDINETYQCREWQVRKAIEDIRGRGQGYLNRLGRWLEEDVWTNEVWLPQFPNWKTLTAGARPTGCPNP